MAEFLDKDGLAYFWGKLQSYVRATIKTATEPQFDNVNIALRRKANSSDVNKIVTYKTKMLIPSSDATNTVDNVGAIVKKDGTSFTESIPDGYYIVPLHVTYHYFASKSDYNSNTENEKYGLTGISAPIKISDKEFYNISFKSVLGTWTEWTGYFEVECLLVKKPSKIPM